MASLLYRLGAFSAKRHWVVIAAWVLILISLSAWSSAAGKHYSAAFEVPGTESQNALDMLDQRFPQATGSSVNVIVTAKTGEIADSASSIATTAGQLANLAGVASVTNPLAANSPESSKSQIAQDGKTAYLSVQLDADTSLQTATGEQSPTAISIMQAGNSLAERGLIVAYTGVPDATAAATDLTDVVGLGVSLLVLIITFGSLLAAGMPLITAAIGVSISGSLLVVLSNFVTLSATTPLLGSMLGLAVGIDYALFLISRHRNNLAAGIEPKQSVAMATATAGTAVVFAGLTVIIALLGLFVVGIPFLGMMGLGAAVAVLFAISIAVTLVPALLGLFGKRLIPKSGSRAWRREQADAQPTLGAKWGRFITAKPLITVGLVLAALLTLALPAMQLRLTLPGAGYDAPGSITRTGYDAMSEAFGPGVNGPLLVVADISETEVTNIESVLSALQSQFEGRAGVKEVSPAIPNETLDTAIVAVTPTTGPNDLATETLVQQLRDAAPAFEKANSFAYEITGSTAIGIDISARLADAILPFGVVVVGLSIVLLMIVFRSLAVPITATLGFVLSVLAAFGVTSAIFMWGWGADLFGVTRVGPVVSFMPILVMAVLFGLAMDYEVFLVSRMRERFVATRDPHGSVVTGFRESARVVTAAALIMFSVFFSFVPGSAALLQPVALALAVGVAIDALIVRMTLIPAIMALLGKYAWALPKAIAAKLPDMDIEGERVRGRLETLQWQQAEASTVAVQTKNLRVLDTPLPPIDLTVMKGELAVLQTDDEQSGQLLLAALTGRADATGLIVSCGRPLPYDGSHVRSVSSLVSLNTSISEGNVEKHIRDGLRFNDTGHSEAEVDEVVSRAERFAEVTGAPNTAFRLSRSAETLSSSERWLLELAIVSLSGSELLAIDTRLAPAAHQAALLETLANIVDAHTTLLATVNDSVSNLEISNRKVIRVGLESVGIAQ